MEKPGIKIGGADSSSLMQPRLWRWLPLLARIKDGKVVEITDNPAKPRHMEGCIKGYQMHRVLYAEDRLRKPLIRVGPRGSGEYKEVSWSEALDYVAGELRRIKTEHGPQSILHLGGSGSTRGSLHNTNRLTKRFLALFGGYTERHSSYSVGAATFVTPYILGTFDAGIDSLPRIRETHNLIGGQRL